MNKSIARQNGKRFCTIFLALAMVFTLMPMVAFADEPSATVEDVTVHGKAGMPIEEKVVTITLQDETFKATGAGIDVSGWFTNLPTGIKAETDKVIAENSTLAAIRLFGTPTVALSTTPMAITVTGAALTNGKAITVTPNPKANFNIEPKDKVSVAEIMGVGVPIVGGIPVDAITPTDEYTGKVSWSPGVDSTFVYNTVYTAKITLTPKAGYTLEGVSENFFKVDGAVTTNASDSAIVTAVFPQTAGSGGGGGGNSSGGSSAAPSTPSTGTGTGNTTISGTTTTTNSDGSRTLTGSGTVKVGDAVSVAAPSGTIVGSNGSVTIPAGKTATVTLSDGSTRITVPGGTTIAGNGTATVGTGTVAMTTPESNAKVTVTEGSTIASDGRVTVGSNGATIGLSNGAEITVSDGATINGERVTAGADGATVKAADGTTVTVPAGTVLILDPDTPLGYSVQISNPFNDVAESGWYYDAVMFVYQKGIMQGTGAGFAPTTTLNRAMLVQMLYNLEGKPAGASAGFNDVSGSDWYAAAVGWASGNNVVSGMPGNMFAPGQSITREQMAVMLYNYCVYKGITLPTVNTGGSFADTGEISAWAADAVNAMYAAGILNGKGDNMFDPKGTATRAEVAQMFMNFMEAME